MPEEIRGKNRPYDIIVIGGGVSGLAIAREAAYWGFDVVLLEAKECFSGTSANSLRIVHGGFRYLQTLDIPRVIESLRDQAAALKSFPGIVLPLPCVMPLRATGPKSRWPAHAARMVYSTLSRWAGEPAPLSSVIEPELFDKAVPLLRGSAFHGALLWHDAVITDLPSFSAQLMREITSHSGTVIEHAMVSHVGREGSLFRVSCERAVEPRSFHARTVVNATGPWMGTIGVEGIRLPAHRGPSSWCRGFNLVVRQQADPVHGIGVESTEGRLYFVVPRGSGSAVGTWYLPFSGDPASATISDQELDDALAQISKALPQFPLSRDDIVTIEVGVLPLRRQKGDLLDLQGPAHIVDSKGYIELVSTKLTSFRSQARAVLRSASKYLR